MRSEREILIKKISKKMMLREDVVEDVVEEFVNEMIAETILNGEFSIKNFFTIKSYKWSGYSQSHRETPVDDHYRLKVKISENLRLLFKFFGPNSDNPNIVNSDNWEKLLKIAKEEKIKNLTEGFNENSNSKKKPVGDIVIENPFLDDYQEEY